METRIKPMIVRDNETGERYELDFTRESVQFAEGRGFEPDKVLDFPTTQIPALWFYAFRANHKKMAKNQTDALLSKIGGVTDAMLERLILLYQQAITSNNIYQDDEDLAKNALVTVELD